MSSALGMRQQKIANAITGDNSTGHKAQALLVTDLNNVRWVTGFSGSNAAALLGPDVFAVATDGRYRDQVLEQTSEVDLDVVIERACAQAMLQHAGAAGLRTVAVEVDDLVVEQLDALTTLAGVLGLELIHTSGVIAASRYVKDAGEIGLLRRACQVSVDALSELAPFIGVGQTEIEIARRLEVLMGTHGGDDRAFPTIVATGSNSAIPHHDPTLARVSAGDLLKIDFGALVEGYHADCTRTFVVGGDPRPWQIEIHEVVQRAAHAGRAMLKPGVDVVAVDQSARSIVTDAGFGENFSHGLGHGVGLEIHEAPLFAPEAAGRLEAGVVATIEPGIYLPGRGGVRIEDTCLVTDFGHEVLTVLDRGLVRLG